MSTHKWEATIKETDTVEINEGVGVLQSKYLDMQLQIIINITDEIE